MKHLIIAGIITLVSLTLTAQTANPGGSTGTGNSPATSKQQRDKGKKVDKRSQADRNATPGSPTGTGGTGEDNGSGGRGVSVDSNVHQPQVDSTAVNSRNNSTGNKVNKKAAGNKSRKKSTGVQK